MSKLTCPVQIKQYLDRAEEYQSRRMYTEAIGQLRQAVQICPESAVAHNNLGAALANHGKYDEAEEEFQQAIALAAFDPYVPHPYLDAEQNLIKLGVARTETPKSCVPAIVVRGAAIVICFLSSLLGFNGNTGTAKILATCGYLGAFASGRVLARRSSSYFTMGAGIWTIAIFLMNVILRYKIASVPDAVMFFVLNLLGFLAAYHAGARPH